MKDIPQPEGAILTWYWGDTEIDHPGNLKGQLDEIRNQGFKGVLVILRNSRYELIDRKVIRAVTQASQWAKRRRLEFWFQADPRQASRTLITKTSEHLECLMPYMSSGRSRTNVKHSVRVKKNKFELKYRIPRTNPLRYLPEKTLQLNPVGVERVFLYQKNDDAIAEETVRDISNACRFHVDMTSRTVTIFGDIRVPDHETWWVLAFPKFETNLFDYAGRESKDLFHHLVEDFFDAGAYLDGVIWDELGCGDQAGLFPVSLSLYNCFKAEFGYDIREVLYALVMDTEAFLHIPIRCDYYTFLRDTAFVAQKEFHQMLNSFFGRTEMGLIHHWVGPETSLRHGCCESLDPWHGIGAGSIGLSEIDHTDPVLPEDVESILSRIIIAKSLGVFSQSQKSFSMLSMPPDTTATTLGFWTDLFSVYSVHWVVRAFHKNGPGQKRNHSHLLYPGHPTWTALMDFNWKMDLLDRVTGFHFPETNVAFVFPVETMLISSPRETEKIGAEIHQLIARLTEMGIQIDVISPLLLRNARFAAGELELFNRYYSALIYPYPTVVYSHVFDILVAMQKCKFPVCFLGDIPRFTNSGESIQHPFQSHLSPGDITPDTLKKMAIRPIFEFPENSLGSLIRTPEGPLFLFTPRHYGVPFEGCVKYEDITFDLPASSGLIVFRKGRKGKVEQIL